MMGAGRVYGVQIYFVLCAMVVSAVAAIQWTAHTQEIRRNAAHLVRPSLRILPTTWRATHPIPTDLSSDLTKTILAKRSADRHAPDKDRAYLTPDIAETLKRLAAIDDRAYPTLERRRSFIGSAMPGARPSTALSSRAWINWDASSIRSGAPRMYTSNCQRRFRARAECRPTYS